MTLWQQTGAGRDDCRCLAGAGRGPTRLGAAGLSRGVTPARAWPHPQSAQPRRTSHDGPAAPDADPDILNRDLVWPTPLEDALNLLAGAALTCQQRWDSPQPAWTLIVMFNRGRLLPPPLHT
jgi:hypothetical protein